MEEKRDCEAVEAATARATAHSHSQDAELPKETDVAGGAAAQSLRKRRAIFSDDDGDAEDEAPLQVFSVDTTAASEATMQPEREGVVPRASRREAGGSTREPLRARRILDLMDQLDAQDSEKEDESLLLVRRSWKRRLTTTTTSISETSVETTEAHELVVPPLVERLARSHSSHSVFLAPPKMTFARSTSTPGGNESAGPSSVAAAIHTLVLPTVRSRNHPDLNVISPHTVADLLAGVYGDRLDGFSLIDCRFGYEFAAGSLKGAVSMNDPAQVEEKFLRKPPSNSARTALIFYCEFSANRAPKMLRHVRNLDRWIHAERYPELFYPELYLVDGGYKNCFETLKDVICHPAQYQTMSDKAFVDQCKKDFATHRANWKLHKSNACASKFQQLHRHIHDVFGDDSSCEHRRGEDDLLANPVSLRSFSQQL